MDNRYEFTIVNAILIAVEILEFLSLHHAN